LDFIQKKKVGTPKHCLVSLNYEAPTSIESCHMIESEDDDFQLAIDRFRRISKNKLAWQKLQIIHDTRELIPVCLKNLNFEGVLDADKLMIIWIYILHKAKVTNLHSQIRFIEEFSSENEIFQTFKGHSFCSMQAAVECLTML